ncbi:MAG: hypothetical protein HQL12_01280 [Candidatus Omnitrophica bacterium]|nr:hypothetical protein [Candidatus Omnitrophota bacterium]
MSKIAFVIFLAAFFLLQPLSMGKYGLMYPNDDVDYFAQSSSLAFGQFPSYKNEYLTTLKEGPKGSIGSGILAAVFVFAFSLIDRMEGSKILEKRTRGNVPSSWAVYGFIFSSVFYLCLGCYLLYLAAEAMVGGSFAAWAVALMVLCQGMPLFAFNRPIFSHTAEFFMQSLFVYLFVINELSGGRIIKQWWAYVLLGIAASLVFLTRNNDVLLAIVWPLFFIGRNPVNKSLNNVSLQFFYIAAAFISMILVFKIWPETYNHYNPYPDWLNNITMQTAWQNILMRIGYVFTGLDWGLIFTAPFLLLGVVGFFFIRIPWAKRYVLATLPLLVNFYTIVSFGSQGGWYGYRYLIAAAFPLLVIPLAFFLKWTNGKIGPFWKWGAVLLSIMPAMSMLCFIYNERWHMSVIPVFFGREDWGIVHYQVLLWQTILNSNHFFQGISIGGIAYFHYLYDYALFLLSHVNVLFNGLLLESTTFIRTILIYILPFTILKFFDAQKIKK